MRRGIAVVWHIVSFLIATALYVFFVMPRWPELTGDTSHALGTAMRILAGLSLGVAAVPVALTLFKTRRPEFGTPQLALSLRVWSIVGHVTAGVLIFGTAIAEIWLDLDVYGRWLFAVYGAAAAIALLGAAAFYLAYAAELPPPPPKPLKPKKQKAEIKTEAAETEDAPAAGELVEDLVEDQAPSAPDDEPADVSAEEDEPAKRGLQNRRPTATKS